MPKKESKKRIDIVKVSLVRDKTIHYATRRIRQPSDAADLIREYLGDVDREHFVLLCLNSKLEPTHIETVHIGSLASSIVAPREVFKTAILTNSGSIMVAHNHPSDDTNPSPQDLEVTERLVQSGNILGIQLMDHLIISSDGFYSFKTEHSHLF